MKFLKRTWAVVHLDRLKANYDVLSSLLSDSAEFMAVVKADAYGHNDKAIASALHKWGVNSFAVSNLNEAIKIRESSATSDILILGYTPVENAEDLIRHNITQTILSTDYAMKLYDSLKDNAEKLRVHIAIDTGMHRIGLNSDNPEECAEQIHKMADLFRIEGIFTHFAVADSDEQDNTEYTRNQAQKLHRIATLLKERGICDNSLRVHSLNSAAALTKADNQSSFARFGIIMYGLYPDTSMTLPVKVTPVLDWLSVVSMVKDIKKGDCVSYGRTFIAQRDMKIATIPVGYADGYPRALSGCGEMLLHRKRCPILGRVCMDQLMIDVSEVDNVNIGDTVTLLGRDGSEQITADDLAQKCGTIGYEIICGISKRVPRQIMENGETKEILNYI